MADVKAEVNRSIELEEFKKMKESVEGASKEVESAIQTQAGDFEKTWAEVTDTASHAPVAEGLISHPAYSHPGKKWRVKQGATPTWYKARSGIRTKALSGAARVARYRPQKFN